MTMTIDTTAISDPKMENSLLNTPLNSEGNFFGRTYRRINADTCLLAGIIPTGFIGAAAGGYIAEVFLSSSAGPLVIVFGVPIGTCVGAGLGGLVSLCFLLNCKKQ